MKGLAYQARPFSVSPRRKVCGSSRSGDGGGLAPPLNTRAARAPPERSSNGSGHLPGFAFIQESNLARDLREMVEKSRRPSPGTGAASRRPETGASGEDPNETGHDGRLLAAGIKIYEFVGGLLHTKSLTLDGEVTLIGSANMDRRSFDLNYENNILFCDPALTAAVRDRQQSYISRSNAVTREVVASWPMSRRLWNNTIAMLGPIL